MTSSTILFNHPGTTVAAGDSVFVTLLGFQYAWAGDLTVTLAYTPQGGGTTISVDLFNRLGVIDPTTDVGYGSIFGGPQTNGGNYRFDVASVNDLWTTAGGQGTSNGIPDGTYFPLTAGHVTPSPNLNTAFTGVDLSGTWQILVQNYDPMGSQLPAPSAGFNHFTGWQLDLSVDAPEPSYAPLLLGLGTIGFLVVRRRQST